MHSLECIKDSLLECFSELDGNQLTVKCNFNGCFKAKEVANRCGLNIQILSGQRDSSCPRTLDGCFEMATPMLLRIDFEVYADDCHEGADKKATSGLALVDWTLCEKARLGKLPFVDLERAEFAIDNTHDRKEYTRTYRRLRQTWRAKTVFHACDPGAVPIGCS